MKSLLPLVLYVCLLPSISARADLFGGDVAVLTQLLANSVRQLSQLRELLGSAKANIDLIREIHRGIDDAINLARTISPNVDPGIYREWQHATDALSKLEGLYGRVEASTEARVQKDADQSVVETISLNNDIYAYTAQIDRVGEEIKAASRAASPGGAQRLTA
jgi:hypothetical protein